MSVLSVFDGSTRALEIVRIASRHEWSFLSQLLRRGEAAETRLPLPSVLCNLLTELGPVSNSAVAVVGVVVVHTLSSATPNTSPVGLDFFPGSWQLSHTLRLK